MTLSDFISRRFWYAALAPLVVMGLAMFCSIRLESQTIDEGVYLAVGYSYLKTGDYRLNCEHPPLAKLLAALPLLVFQPDLPLDPDSERWPEQYEFGREFLYGNSVPADTLLLAGRAPTIVLTLLFGLLLAWWTRRHFGPAAALIAVTLFAFEPVIIAHGRYATNDLLAALTSFLSCIAWSAWLEQPSRRRLIMAGLALGLALAAKYSAFLLLPVLATLYLIRWRQRSPSLGLRHGLTSLLIVGLLSTGVLFVLYQFEFGPMNADPGLHQILTASTGGFREGTRLSPKAVALVHPNTPRGSTVHWIARNVPIPAFHFAAGLFHQVNHNWRGHRSYLMGRVSRGGSPLYFPVAFAVKSSVALLLLAGLAAALAVHRGLLAGFRKISLRWLVITLPPAFYFSACLTSRINIGVRYILPVYPFLFAFIGAALFHLAPARLRRAVQAAGLALSALLVWESATAYPEYLAFFNRAAGGPVHGPRYLLDSNIDWGQNLKKLKTYLDSRGIAEVCLDYWNIGDPDYYGIRHIPLEAGTPPARDCVLAVGVHQLYSESGYQWLLGRTPTARIGYGVYVYEPR